MIRPDTKTLSALASLSSDQSFAVVMAWMAASREEARDDLEAQANSALFGQLQGYSLCLRDILEHAKNARESLSKTGR